jgi:diguanylate cyclase (GGDEF)-like protein/PAS domain S-box-containing protein
MLFKPSFSTRIALYFGSLFSIAMLVGLGVWYAGLPWLNLTGARDQRLVEATSLLEASANHQLGTIRTVIAERRGDVKLLAESPQAIAALTAADGRAQRNVLDSFFKRIERAYPDQYDALRLIAPNGRVLASTIPAENDQPFSMPELVARASAPGTIELVEQITNGDHPALAIVRQVVALDADGYPSSGVLGILVASVRVDALLTASTGYSRTGYTQPGSSLVLGVGREPLALLSPKRASNDDFLRDHAVANGFEGVLQVPDTHGAIQLAVYRHIQLNGRGGWTLIHFQSQDDALRGLNARAFAVVMVGGLIALLSFGLIFIGARKLTSPLRRLGDAANALGRGTLSARAVATPRDSSEFAELTRAFNDMADSMEYSQRELEAKVRDRTQALGYNEERLRLAVAAGNLGIYDCDMRTGATATNAEYASMLGFDPSSFIETLPHWIARTHPEDRARAGKAYRQYVQGSAPEYQVEFRQRKRDGDWIWILSKGSIVQRDADGAPLRMIGTHANITEHKAVEARLGLAATVFSHAREGILITDADGAIVEVNETFSTITGYSRMDALGKDPRQLLDSGRQGDDFYAMLNSTLNSTGSWSGELWSRRKSGEPFAELRTTSVVHDKAGSVRNYVTLFSDISTIKAHQRQLEHIAHFDALTGLPNRVLLADRLQHAMAQCRRRNQSLAVAFLDLDGFKAVNDLHGHEMGDRLLVALSGRMRDALRDGDTLSRIGGDEFVAVLVELEAPNDCEPILHRLLLAAADAVQIDGTTVQVSASVGVTIYPQDGADSDLLLRHADQAMYLAKQAGKNRYHLFDVDYDVAVKSRRETAEHIGQALKRNEFVLYYQPRVNMRTGAIVGAEALIRWQHPERGLLAPATFLPAIEDQPVSVAVGEWVIATALAQMSQWKAMGLAMPVSVNIGARQLQDAGFVATLARLLAAQADVAAHSLELEVLETSAMEDVAYASQVMQGCKALGVHFALDDFGTGYSSLTYLKRLPAKVIKIDQSFVRDMLTDTDDLAIVRGVIGLAKAFRREVIAEGVETIAHGKQLLLMGCELAQGYGIARPMPAADLPQWAAQWTPDAQWLPEDEPTETAA